MRLRFLYRAAKARFRDQTGEIKAALEALRPGGCAVDVGANKGAYLYWLQRAVGPGGKVYAFEPQPRLATYLQTITRKMGWDHVVVRASAISDFQGTAQLHVPGDGPSPGASLVKTVSDSTPGQTYECPVDTLDLALPREKTVDLLKVDVEGNELAVFRGAERTLREYAPCLIFESERRHLTSHTLADVFAFLQDRDYEGFFFSPQGLQPVREFKPEIHQAEAPGRFWDRPGYCNNFLFRSRRRPPTAAPI